MRLSMSMVEHWFRRYSPVATIASREATITGIRHLNSDRDMNPDYVYAGRICDMTPYADRDVVLVHRQDVIRLQTEDMDEIFDSFMDAMTYYEKWEKRLMEAADAENPEQALIQACSDIFGPMFFINMQLQMSAYSENYPDTLLEDCWNRFWKWDRGKALQSGEGHRSSFLQIFNQIWDRRPFFGNSGEEYPYSLVISQVAGSNQLMGQLFLLSASPFEEYQLQLAEVLQKHLCQVAGQESGACQISAAVQMFAALLHGERSDEECIQMLYEMKSWREDEAYLPFVLRRENDSKAEPSALLNGLERYFPEALAVPDEIPVQGGRTEPVIAGCLPVPEVNLNAMNEEDVELRLRALLRFCREQKMSLHVGYFLQGLKKIHWHYRQAQIAAGMGQRYFYHCAVSLLTFFGSDRTLCLCSLHPVPMRMREYDKKQGTDFYEILKAYLQNECNRAQTARQLYVHKNTLAYRLERLEEMFPVNLDDPYEREYLRITISSMENREEDAAVFLGSQQGESF